jgi:NAD(P)-dependent dehydrogenase (short-subunit alcohol dehydrogenase family)
VVFTGRPDLVVFVSAAMCKKLANRIRLTPGYYIVDHKFVRGRPPQLFLSYDLSLQFVAYPMLWDALNPKKPIQGSIVNISSMATLQVLSGVLGYSMAKAAIDTFTKWMAVDLAKRFGSGLRVNAVAPGFFITSQNRDVLVKPDGSYTARSEAILKRTPAGRFGNPEELKGTVVWLCSDAASFVTGTVIPVDGGFNIDSGI